MPPVKVLRNGKAYLNCNIGLLVNHSTETIAGIPEEIVIKGAFQEKRFFSKTPTTAMKEMARIPLSDFIDMGGYSYYECGLWWEVDLVVERFQIFYATSPKTGKPQEIRITDPMPLEFSEACYEPSGRAKDGALHADLPFNGSGRWHLSHAFDSAVEGNNLVYLWRYAVPAIFECHSHVMSNHCATLPAIWEKDGFLAALEPGYTFQDVMGPVFKGEMVSHSIVKTAEVAITFHKHLKESPFFRAFPGLMDKAYAIGTVLPMDMDFMHYLGYEGVPIVKDHLGAKWYCWNRKWKRTTNNQETYHTHPHGGVRKIPKPYASEPSPVDGETWRFMSSGSAKKYTPWDEQYNDYIGLLGRTSKDKNATVAPLIHFDPRRYSGKGSGVRALASLFAEVVQCGGIHFTGIKLYTAMGWAPMDPLLKHPLMEFYSRCESDQIPLINHCSPAGFYTHDRKFYFDLHKEKGRLDTSRCPDKDGWPTKFTNWASTPQNTYRQVGGLRGEPSTEMEKIWWYCQNYVNPVCWTDTVAKFPKLKLCFAHLASSDHLEEGTSWKTREKREPENAPRNLTIGFNGSNLDPSKTHSFLYELLELIQPENRIFTDLSYVILNERNVENFRKLFTWARQHKPILLERILWGTDWPLIGDDNMVKDADVSGLKKPPILYKYAKGFAEHFEDLPADFFFRACFLNPMQFWRMDTLKNKAPSSFPHAWIDDVPSSILDDYASDKVELFYKQNPALTKKLAG